jgi:hypothetical protein
MAGKVRRVFAHAHPLGAFAVRGRAIRTFASFALAIALGLVVLGVYLIADEFRNPLASQSIGLFAAAFVLATAMTLLVELTQIFRSASRHSPKDSALLFSGVDLTARIRVRTTYQPRDHRTNLPYQRNYVDRVRVRA